MTDPGERTGEQRLTPREIGMPLQLRLSHGGADAQRLAIVVDTAQRIDLHDINQQARAREPHRQHRHQRLAAGDDPCVAAFLAQRVQSLVDLADAQIIERRGLHRPTPISASSRRIALINGEPRLPLALLASASKNWPMTTLAAPSSRRPPIEATLPPTAAS